jgi:hypothetical protein
MYVYAVGLKTSLYSYWCRNFVMRPQILRQGDPLANVHMRWGVHMCADMEQAAAARRRQD